MRIRFVRVKRVKNRWQKNIFCKNHLGLCFASQSLFGKNGIFWWPFKALNFLLPCKIPFSLFVNAYLAKLGSIGKIALHLLYFVSVLEIFMEFTKTGLDSFEAE